MILILPLDGTEPSHAAIPIARTLAQIEGATLHILHVAASATTPGELLEELGLTSDEARGAVVAPLTGSPGGEILRHARETHPSTIVMCAHTGERMEGAALGHVARAVVQARQCPVVLVPPSRGHRQWALQQILLPHNGLPTTVSVLRQAALLADRAHAELAVLHVATFSAVVGGIQSTLSGPRYVDQPQHEWPSWALEFVQRARALGAMPESVRMRLFVAFGDTAATIAEFAVNQQTDLIVVPMFGEPELAGSLLEEVLGQAPCPIMVLPAEKGDGQGV